MGQATAFIDYLIDKAKFIPDAVLEKAKDCLCDYLAVTAAGAEANRARWSEYLRRAGDGRASVIGFDCRTDGLTAALINGFNAHSLELDDGQRFGMIHLGASVLSALMSAQAEHEINRSDLLKGIVIGYEAACRLALAIQPSHKNCGFHAAGTCGTVGSAMAAAFALNMNRAQLETVLTAAIAGAAGLLEIQEQASEMKPYNVGRAAMDGLSAVYMGFTDFRGPKDILNGERGFMKLFSREYHPEKLTEIRDYFEIERIYVKPYASCRHCHCAVEAALKIRARRQIDPGSVSSVEVRTYRLAVKGHDHTQIAGRASAKLSIPYSTAAALTLGLANEAAFDDACLSDAALLALTERVKVAEDPDFTRQSAEKRITAVCVHFADGTSETQQVDYARGEPENPMSRAEIIQKAHDLLGEGADRIVSYIYNEEI